MILPGPLHFAAALIFVSPESKVFIRGRQGKHADAVKEAA